MIEDHVAHTGSRRGREILADWEHCLHHFVKVFPTDYKRALGMLSREDEAVEREGGGRGWSWPLNETSWRSSGRM